VAVKAFVDENFAFNGKRLTGAAWPSSKPRWKRCVSLVAGSIARIWAAPMSADAYPPEAKARTEALVAAITQAYEDDLKSVDG